MRHVLVMTAAMAAGLAALFLVDLADVYFLSLLKDAEVMAAIGFAIPLLYFSLSIALGASIAMGALVARHVGAGDETTARHFVTNIFLYGALITGALAALLWAFMPEILQLLGARDRTHGLALSYMRIILPSMPLLLVASAAGAALRAIGQPMRSALTMLSASLINALFDPILIFVLGMGIEGAAWASVLGRAAGASLGLFWLIRRHHFAAAFSWAKFRAQMPPFLHIAVPAILTNIASPVGHSFVISQLSHYGPSIMSGAAVMWRLVPTVFVALYALSASLGPIIGQNFGAGRRDRVRQSFTDAQKFILVYVAVMAFLLFLAQDWVIDAFHVTGEGAQLVAFYMTWLTGFFIFEGMTFSATAAFNNLGHPRLAMVFNWAKATLGTIPFVIIGGKVWGAYGVMMGVAAGSLVFGLAALALAYWIIGRQSVPATAPSTP